MGPDGFEIEVGDPATPDTTERVEFLVDSGAIYSVGEEGDSTLLSAFTLEALGLAWTHYGEN
jgi:hypothetical protein